MADRIAPGEWNWSDTPDDTASYPGRPGSKVGFNPNIQPGQTYAVPPIGLMTGSTDIGGGVPGGSQSPTLTPAAVKQYVQSQSGGGGGGGTSGDPPSAAAATDPSTAAILKSIANKNLSMGQANTPTLALIEQLGAALSQMPVSQAQKYISDLQGTSLGSDLSKVFNPNAQAKPDQGLPSDPFNVSQYAAQVVSPFLLSQEGAYNKGIQGLADQMQTALKGAPGWLQSDLGPAAASLNASLQAQNNAAAGAAVMGPSLTQQLQAMTDYTNQLKLTQAAAGAEPYWAMTTGTGTTPTGSSPAANSMAALYAQQAMMNQGA